MLMLRRPLGSCLTIRGDGVAYFVCPRSVEWYGPLVVVGIGAPDGPRSESIAMLDKLTICQDVEIQLLGASWESKGGIVRQDVLFGITAPEGTPILREERLRNGSAASPIDTGVPGMV